MIAQIQRVFNKLKAHMDNYTAARATYLDAAISSRAAASTALSTATWTATRAAYLDYINSLNTRLTDARALKLDNLDAPISSRAAASTALSTATWTATRAGYLDQIPNIGKKPSGFQTSAPTAVHASNTHLNIAGSGELRSLLNGTDVNQSFTIQIDGGSIYQVLLESEVGSAASIYLGLRFNTSLLVKCSVAATNLVNAWAVLD